jgi:hypothetical protein
MHATIDTRFYGIWNSTDITSVFWNSLECRRVCIWLGLLLVGGLSSYQKIAREAREFIPWTVKTFDRRG